jgi:tetratricopeptide (TPR) repeat protein
VIVWRFIILKTNPKEKNKAMSAKKELRSKKTQEVIKAQKIKEIGHETQWDISHTIAFWGLGVLLLMSPYFRGLFFAPEQEQALIFAAVIFWFAWLWKWIKRDYNFLSHPLDYFVLAFPVVYLISAFQAVNYGLAVDEVVKTTLYFMVYWLASRLVRNDNDIVMILNVIYISALGVSLAGLGTASGIIYINDGFLDGRIYSTFQYPNALASFLAAVMFLGFYLWRRTGLPETDDNKSQTNLIGVPDWLNTKNVNKYLYAAGNFLLLTVFIGSKSQGGFLVFTIMLVLFIIGLPKNNRIPVIIHFIFIGLSSLVAIWQFLSSIATKNMGVAWLWIFAGLGLTIAGQALYNYSERKGLLQWITLHKKVIGGLFLLVLITSFAGAGIYMGNHSDAVKTLVEEMRNATERMYFFQDAMKMFKERPILGWGGGGWQEAYRAFQGYLYNSNQVHGHYFQIMVETGVVGLLVIMGIWASFLLYGHRLYHGTKENEAKRFIIWTISIAAISIGMHAVIDFDLSLSALALVLWTLFGLVRGFGIYSSGIVAEEKKSKKHLPPKYYVLTVVSVVSMLLVFFAGSLALAGSYYSQAGIYIQAKNLNKGVNLMIKASSYNPFNADYHNTLAQVYQAMGKYDEGIAEARKAITLSKYSATRNAELASLYFNSKKSSADAIIYAEKALSLAPFQIQWYEFLAETYFTVGINECLSGNTENAKMYFQEAVRIPARINSRMESIGDLERQLWMVGPLLSPTPQVKINMGSSQYMLGMWKEAETNLQAASKDEKTKGMAQFWLSILKSKQGKTQEAQTLLEEAKKLAPQLAQNYEIIKNIPVIENK